MRRCRRWCAALLLLVALCSGTAGVEGATESDRGAWAGAGAGAGAAARRLGETARRGLREIRRLWPKRSTPQLNVTGTFRGEWTQLAWPSQLALGAASLQQGGGVTVLKLRHVGGGQVSMKQPRRTLTAGLGLITCVERWAYHAWQQPLTTGGCAGCTSSWAAGHAAGHTSALFPHTPAGRRLWGGWRDGASGRAVRVLRRPAAQPDSE